MNQPSRAVLMVKKGCGRGCDFCPLRRGGHISKPLVMRVEVFDQVLNWLPSSIEEVCLEGWSEPSTAIKFPYFVRELKKRDYKVHVTTYGRALESEVIDLIDSLSINFMTQSTADRLVFWKYHPDARNSKVPKARFSFTLNKRTMRLLPAAIESTAVYGFDSLKINYMKAYTKEMLPYVLVLDDSFREWQEAMTQFAVSRGAKIQWPAKAQECLYSYNIVHIETNGAVMPCVAALKRIGSVDEPFEQVWKRDGYDLYRANKHKMCERCIYCNAPGAELEALFNQVDTVLPYEINV